MILYHFTTPANAMLIASDGLRMNVKHYNALMTGGIPVVWLTRQQSNITTADDLRFMKTLKPDLDGKVGDLSFGGNARLSVQVERHNKKLVRYTDFLDRCGREGAKEILTLTARNNWYVYLGDIPPHKVDTSMPASLMIECFEWHISTHGSLEARVDFRRHLDRLVTLPPDTPVHFSVERELADA